MAVVILLAIFLITLLAIGWFHTQYFKRRNINGPPLIPFIGVLDRLGDPKNPNVFKYHEWSKKYGKVFGLQKGRTNILVVSDPDMANELFTTKFEVFHERERNPMLGNPDTAERAHVFRARGKRWKRLRTISNPVFSVQNLKKIIPTVEDSSNETVKLLEANVGKEFDIHPFMHEYTMDVISRIAIGQTESKQFQNNYTKILIDTFNGGSHVLNSLAWSIPQFGTVFQKMALLRSFLKQKGIVVLLKNVYKAVNDRKAARAAGEISEDSIDFIDFFLNAESDLVEQETAAGVYDKSTVNVTKKLTFDEVVGQLNLFLLAGFDTTANTLSLTAFYLAKYPEIQEKLRQEIEENCPSPDVSYEDLAKLKYAEAIMKEVLRFHPIAAMALNRTAATNTTLGDLSIEEGTCVHVNPFAIHFNKEKWGQDAEKFEPERWIEGRAANDYYFPFGFGPRLCIGMRLAYIEEKLLLVHILRRFKIENTPKTGDQPVMVSNAVLNPENIYVRLVETN